MKRLFFVLTLLALCIISVQSDPVDIRRYLDGSTVYAQTDSMDTAATYSDTVWTTGARLLVCDLHVTTIGTNVVVRLECSNDGVNFMNCSADGSDLTITVAGTHSIIYDRAAAHRYYRLYWVSELGGTAAKMLPSFSLGDRI